ncbi:DsbA family protein [Jatrophihabitans telluris]|uniref:DsbA family protein n=1 Tax=Jatrophihabitans telluris TaxID=2038343 RepID=A0ABY4QZ42_9ACTN|nr:thioredoxin domain-containing protein [Jatrophihabitans telluris]UQX88849.1 DsbA family protein [Jatrophihabitans telluris]
MSAMNPPAAEVLHVYGSPDAPLCIVEFGDYECPYCAGVAPVLQELVDSSDGRIRLIFRNFPLFEVHPHALTAALAAESVNASAGAEAFWRMHHKLFQHQARLTDADLRLYASSVGGDPDQAVGDTAQQFAPIVQADYAAGLQAGVSATPTLFIDGTAYEGRLDLNSLRRASGLLAGADSGTGRAESGRRPWQRR